VSGNVAVPLYCLSSKVPQ